MTTVVDLRSRSAQTYFFAFFAGFFAFIDFFFALAFFTIAASLILVKWRYRESIFANQLHAFRSLHGSKESGDSARIDVHGPGGKFYLEKQTTQ